MKHFLILAIAVLFYCSAESQVMPGRAQWVTIKSGNLRCWECKEKLETYLIGANVSEMDNGMLERRYNLLAGEIRIKYLPDRVTPAELRAAINNAGFDTDNEKAEDSAYKKLPPICKREEDGGGPKLRKGCQVEPN